MTDDGPGARSRITESIQNASPFTDPAGVLDGVVIGWVLITEWSASDGQRWLAKTSADASGQILPSWQERGYLHDALFGEWPHVDPE